MRVTAFFLSIVVATLASACGGNNNSAPSPVFDVTALQTIDTVVGTGAEATAGRTVTVHYTGWLYNPQMPGNKGEQFDSSRTNNQPLAPFVLGGGSVIVGWERGLVGMRAGGQRTLLIPSSMGYGSRGSGRIPPNSGLVFDVELLGVR